MPHPLSEMAIWVGHGTYKVGTPRCYVAGQKFASGKKQRLNADLQQYTHESALGVLCAYLYAPAFEWLSQKQYLDEEDILSMLQTTVCLSIS